MAEGSCCSCCGGLLAALRVRSGGGGAQWKGKPSRPGSIHGSIASLVGEHVLTEKRHREATIDLSELLIMRGGTRSFGQHYQMLTQIGSGAFGSVYKAKSLVTGEVRAVKVMPKTGIKQDTESLAVELEAMIRLRHPNVLSFYEFFEEHKAICLVMELCDGGDFSTLNQNKKSDDEVRILFRDVFLGVAYCHSQGVVHRDLKFENSLIALGARRRVAKVIDFGLAAIRREYHNDEWLEESLGTKFFIAPEVIDKRQHYGAKCDAWSLGVMIYIVLSNEHPFAEKAFALPTKRLFHLILTAEMRTRPLERHRTGSDARNIIKSLLERRADERMDIEEALELQWLRPQAVCEELKMGADICRSDSRLLQRRISTLGQTGRFQRVILMLSAHHAKMDDVEKMRLLFIAQDKNCDGVISLAEFQSCVGDSGWAASKDLKEMQGVFNNVDANVNEEINYAEWLSATVDEATLVAQENMKELFDYFDRDGNGSISREELAECVGPDEAQHVLRDNDSSRDGALSWDEFRELMFKLARLRASGQT